MSKQNPYFSLDGQCFQTPGSEMETAANVQIAMNKVRAFVMEGGNQEDAQEAITWLQAQYPKLKPCCTYMAMAFAMDEFDDSDAKARIARKAYNCLADRLSGTPL